MSYSDSHLDRNIRSWFENDNTRALLRGIRLVEGHLRGLTQFDLEFNFPISAVAGKNGCGKSTLLAIAACAYHNHAEGFKLNHRAIPYYRYSDFFIQHKEELPPEGIDLLYKIAHNNWRKSEYAPDGIGVLYQTRKKPQGGRWTNYDRRVPRDVVFLGIERIVPHNEKSQSKSYSKAFESSEQEGWEAKVMDAVGKVLNKQYDDFRFVSHSKYRLPIVSCENKVYSGFNMGAGENALFEVFSVLFSIGKGGLVIIDEIELGLHAEAQKKLINEIKEVCKERKIQIICTTHSKNIFDSLPFDARFFLESRNSQTVLTPEITSDFAFSKLSNQSSSELTVMVEDKVAKNILLSALTSEYRRRISIEVIGSVNALLRQLAANYDRASSRGDIVILLDGDQSEKSIENKKYFKKFIESDYESDFFEKHVSYLPSNSWPEKLLLDSGIESVQNLSILLNSADSEVLEALNEGNSAGKHNEIYTVAKKMGLGYEEVLSRLCMNLQQNHSTILTPICEDLTVHLEKQ